MSQMSCSSAGPRGPAVMMLVLSATGAPVALVKVFDLDMVNSRVPVYVMNAYARQAEPRITLEKLAGVKCGSLSASTSALTSPRVVCGLRLPIAIGIAVL